jgi:ProP effector
MRRLHDMLSNPEYKNTRMPSMTTPTPTPSPVQAARALLKELQKQFTVLGECMPLAIGIDKQLVARLPEFDRKILRAALGIHANSLRYLRNMEKATVRFDLDGNSTDEVTETHRTHASKILRERFKKDAERRKAQREADEVARQHAEKLDQLAAKFSRQSR